MDEGVSHNESIKLVLFGAGATLFTGAGGLEGVEKKAAAIGSKPLLVGLAELDGSSKSIIWEPEVGLEGASLSLDNPSLSNHCLWVYLFRMNCSKELTKEELKLVNLQA